MGGGCRLPWLPSPSPRPPTLGSAICQAQWCPEAGPPFSLDFLLCLPVLRHPHARWAALGVLLDLVAKLSSSPSAFTVQSAKLPPIPREQGWVRSGLQAGLAHVFRGAGSPENAGHSLGEDSPSAGCCTFSLPPVHSSENFPCPSTHLKLAGGCKPAGCWAPRDPAESDLGLPSGRPSTTGAGERAPCSVCGGKPGLQRTVHRPEVEVQG